MSRDEKDREISSRAALRPTRRPLLTRALYRLREISLIRTAYAGCRLRRSRVFVYPRVHLGLESGCVVQTEGVLHLGRRWERCAFLPSQLNMLRDSRLELAGDFSVYTGFSLYINRGARLELGSGYANNGLNLSCFEAHFNRLGRGYRGARDDPGQRQSRAQGCSRTRNDARGHR